MIRTQMTPYNDGDVSLTGFFVWDGASGDKRPGVLVVHGGAGLDRHAKQRAQQLAGFGYVTFACDLFGDGIAGDRPRVIARVMELNGNLGRLCQRVRAGIDMLASHPLVNGHLAAVGYCFGGMTVLQLARSGTEIAGVASIHGSLKTTRRAEASGIRTKILVCHGALDPHVPMEDVISFIEEMKAAGADWQLSIYGNAMHGFTHEDAAAFKNPGVAYNALADQRSSEALQAFLTELFRPL
jgi:dienelactone hydrolase